VVKPVSACIDGDFLLVLMSFPGQQAPQAGCHLDFNPPQIIPGSFFAAENFPPRDLSKLMILDRILY
jgi:hypothetical protein